MTTERAPDVTVVVITRNRAGSLRRTLHRLASLPSRPPVIVIDNASDDDTVSMVTAEFPGVRMVPLSRNRGAVARNLGVALAATDLVAFADDDSWWRPGSLPRASEIFDESPGVGLVAARILVGPDRTVDPASTDMNASGLGRDGANRPRVLGFLACGAVVRRSAFAAVGGFDDMLEFIGEEEPLALDLATAGWRLVYAPDVVAVHDPASSGRNPDWRSRRETRNFLLATLSRRSWRTVGRVARSVAGSALNDRFVRAGMVDALRRAPRALARRVPVPAGIEQAKQLLE